MRNNLYPTVVLILISLNALGSDCTFNLIKNEVTKFHGPEWSKISATCSKSIIKSYLKEIITNPENALIEYDLEQQKFIFRNSIKSYGHFGTKNSDLNLLSTIYDDHNRQLHRMFGKDKNLFRITVLEAMANTGNLEALTLYQKIFENDQNELFLQQYALDFSAWIFEGSPLVQQENTLEGSKIYSEIFFPNLETNAETRYQNHPHLLDKIMEKKLIIKNILLDLANRPERFKAIYSSIRSLQKIVDIDEQNQSPNTLNPNNEHFQQIEKKSNPLENTTVRTSQFPKRDLANEKERQEKSLVSWVSILLAICCSTIFILRYKKRKD